MNWSEAVNAMLAGSMVQRECEIYQKLCPPPANEPDDYYDHNQKIYESGEEPMRLAHAWTFDAKPVRIFQGRGSKELFVPTSDHLNATDWIVVTKY